MKYLLLAILGCLIVKRNAKNQSNTFFLMVCAIEGLSSDRLKLALASESEEMSSEESGERTKRGLRQQLNNNVDKHKTHINEVLHGEETEEERQKRVNRSFERMLHFVGIVGQVDSYLSDRAKSIIKTLYKMVESEENNSY